MKILCKWCESPSNLIPVKIVFRDGDDKTIYVCMQCLCKQFEDQIASNHNDEPSPNTLLELINSLEQRIERLEYRLRSYGDK